MYQWMDDRCRNLFVKLRRPVHSNEEILLDYRYSARRQTLWRFGPLAKHPKVPLASKSKLRPRNIKAGPYGEMQIIGLASGSQGAREVENKTCIIIYLNNNLIQLQNKTEGVLLTTYLCSTL
jgi:hypothetical protein